MDASHAIALLRRQRKDLRDAGIRHLAVFGSVARGEEGPDSDVDVVATLDPAKGLTLLDAVRLERELSELLGATVHLTVEPVQKPGLRQRIGEEAIRAF